MLFNGLATSPDGNTLYAGWSNSSYSGIAAFDTSTKAVSYFGTQPGITFNGLAINASLPVPEPETYVMFLVGLGLVGFAVQHQNRTT
jgi:hypothetical protein